MPDYVPDLRMVKFWETEVAPILMPLFNGSLLHLPEIQKQYNEDMATFQKMYGCKLDISLGDKPPKDNAGENGALPFGCSLEDGHPRIIIFMPELQRVLEMLKFSRPYDFRIAFETECLIGIMHEIDHLILGKIGYIKDLRETIDVERVVWARTCENTMARLVTRRDLTDSDKDFYVAWCKSGRDAESQQWKDFIASMYGSIKRG